MQSEKTVSIRIQGTLKFEDLRDCVVARERPSQTRVLENFVVDYDCQTGLLPALSAKTVLQGVR
jgi:hypothetical protein